jgi:uncharacterized protein (DUF433 family)
MNGCSRPVGAEPIWMTGNFGRRQTVGVRGIQCESNLMTEHTVIETSPEVLHGTPVFAGTRVPVKSLFDYLKGGDTLADFLDDFPTVSREQAVRTLELAREDLIDAAIAGRVAAEEAQNPASGLMRFAPFQKWVGRVRATASSCALQNRNLKSS